MVTVMQFFVKIHTLNALRPDADMNFANHFQTENKYKICIKNSILKIKKVFTL